MMKKILFIFLCAGLMFSDGAFLSAANAQSKAGGRRAKTAVKGLNGKVISPEKRESLLNYAKRRQAKDSAVTGDPCMQAPPITLNQAQTGTLAAGDCTFEDGSYVDFYTFTGTAGQAVSISMNSTAFNTFLALFDDAGEIIDLNDDDLSSTNSRIPGEGGVLLLPYTGEYIIAANSFAAGETGSYSLVVNSSAACAATAITYNQTVNGTLAATDCSVNLGGEFFYTDRYTFSGTAGQQIVVATNSTAFDTYLTLYTPSGAGSVEDDDSGGGSNSRIPETGTFTLPETGTYTIDVSSFNSASVGAYTLILTGPAPIAPARTRFDYDGDGKADLSVFRPSTGAWYISGSSNGAFIAQNFGSANDRIVPADYDGDRKTDIAVFRPSTGDWFILNSSNNSFTGVNFGNSSDVPVPADYDGDGKADIAVFRSGAWYRLNSSNGQLITVSFGTSGDRPVAGDYDGDAKADVAVFRPSNGSWYRLNSSTGAFVGVQFGSGTDKTVTADYDGDGKTDIAVFRPSTGDWFSLYSSTGQFVGVNFGSANDLPVPADYDGDGKADIAVFRPSTGAWYQLRSTQGFGAQGFGANGDSPTPNAYVR